MGVKLYINKNHIYLSLCYNGKRWRESTGLTISPDTVQNKKVMKIAEVMRSNREIGIACGGQNIQQDNKQPLYDYCESLANNSVSVQALKYIDKYGGTLVKLTHIDTIWIEDFIEKIKNDPVLKSTASQHAYISFTTGCLKKAFKSGIIKKDPCINVKNVKIKTTKKEFLNIDEIKKLMSINLPNRTFKPVRNGFLLACFTGLRYSDIRTLKYSHIQDNCIIKEMVKTKEPVKIPLSPIASDIIEEVKKDHDYNTDGFLFPEYAENEMVGYTATILNAWSKSAGLSKKVAWHIARHTHAVLLLEQGVDLYTVQKLLGHTKIATTEIYADLTDKKRAEAENALSNAFKK